MTSSDDSKHFISKTNTAIAVLGSIIIFISLFVPLVSVDFAGQKVDMLMINDIDGLMYIMIILFIVFSILSGRDYSIAIGGALAIIVSIIELFICLVENCLSLTPGAISLSGGALLMIIGSILVFVAGGSKYLFHYRNKQQASVP